MSRTCSRTVVFIREVLYLGTKQGYRVKIGSETFPKKKGCVYSSASPLHALESAYRERAGMEP